MPEITKRADRAELARRVERAEKLLQKGKAAEALEEYLVALRDDAENDTVRQLAADLCLSQNRTRDAVLLLGELFERQVNTGDATRASLTYKKLARHGSPTWEQKFRFGQLLEGSNKKLAIGTYESALADLAKLGNKKGSLDVLGRMVALEATQANFLRVAELCSELGETKAAAEAFKHVAKMAMAGGADPAQWWERAYQEDSSDDEITLAYGKGLLAQGQVGAAIFILEPQVNSGKTSPELRETYGEALLAAGRYAEAEPLVWERFEQHPTRFQQVAMLIGQLMDSEQTDAAVGLARKLGQFQAKRGERRQFLTAMQEVTAARQSSPAMLEFLGELFNAANREGDYCQTLLKLFDVYCGTGNFAKAAECLDRAAEVDPYESGHAKRLEMLKGKIDENKFKAIAARFSSTGPSATQTVTEQEATLGASTLQDLMLQAEILVQYGMRGKAVERLQRIQELFPREEERNEDLQRLYLSAGVTPSYAGSAARAAASVAPPALTAAAMASAGVAAVAAADPAAEMRNVTRVAEITRKLYHQTTARSVLTTAVKEIGGHWEVSRCVALMRTPGFGAHRGRGVLWQRRERGEHDGDQRDDERLAGCGREFQRSGDDCGRAESRGVAGSAQGGGRAWRDFGVGVSVEQWRRFRWSAGASAQQGARLAANRYCGTEDIGRSNGDRAQQCRTAAAGQKPFGDGREIGIAEARFLSGFAAGGEQTRGAEFGGVLRAAVAVWPQRRVAQRIWRGRH